MKKALGYTSGFLTQGLLYVVVFGFLLKEGINESYYIWTIGLGSIGVGYLSKVFFGLEGAVGNLIALGLALVFMAWKFSSVDALWLVGVMFFLILHTVEGFIWYTTLKQRSIKTG